VVLDGVLPDHEAGGGLGVAQPFADEGENVAFAVGDGGEASGSGRLVGLVGLVGLAAGRVAAAESVPGEAGAEGVVARGGGFTG
jgi:hypothetical protein